MLLGVMRCAVVYPCTFAENPMRLNWNSMESPFSTPKLALCNFMKDIHELRSLAASLGLAGVDWTFTLEDLPRDSAGESRLADVIAGLEPLEIRYHCAFEGIDLGDADPRKAEHAMEIFKRVCRVVSRVNGRFMTIHMGLGRASMNGLLWIVRWKRSGPWSSTRRIWESASVLKTWHPGGPADPSCLRG